MRLGDQDLWNIYFNKNPEKLYDLNCTWNYREAFCNEVTSYFLFWLGQNFCVEYCWSWTLEFNIQCGHF